MTRTAAVFQHVAFEDLGSFEAVLLDRGYCILNYQLGVDDVGPAQAEQPDLLVVLGGPISVNDTAVFPFLRDEVAALRSRLMADAPCLGICLGAQLMSVALGGSVAPMPRKEIGWSALTFGERAESDEPLTLLEGTPVLHWHGEQFTLPKGAAPLASTQLCENQAFAWKKNGLALQFHPEVTASGLERWYIGHIAELSAARCDILALRAESQRQGEALRERARAFFEGWLSQRGL